MTLSTDATVEVSSVTIAAGTANIGDVDVLTVPSDPFGANADAASATGSISAKLRAIAVTGVPITSIAAGTNNIGDVDIASIAAGTNNIGDVDIASIAAGTNTIGNVVPVPATSGGLLIYKSLDLDESEEEVKATAGQVYGWAVTNTATTTRWLKFYNDTAANVIVGTAVPVITWGIPGNTSDDVGANVMGAQGIAFSSAITIACTTLPADNDATAPATGDLIVNIFYK